MTKYLHARTLLTEDARFTTRSYGWPMSIDEKLEAVQAVVERVTAYQDGAPEGTVEDELRKGLTEAEVELDDEEIHRLAEAIEAEHGSVSVKHVLS
jgi:hypothetical protein